MRVIENQPWIFQARNETQDCKKDETACNKIADGDDIYVQFEVEPCDGAILCDSDFGAAQGNLVSNGNFDGSASGWSLGATWSYDAGGFVKVDDTVGSNLTQSIGVGLNEDECYVLMYTITDYVSGTLTPMVGGVSGTSVSAAGTYREVIQAGATDVLTFASSGNPNEFALDNIQLYAMGTCWCPDNGNIYSDADAQGLFCHVAGVETVISQVNVVPPIVTGRTYRVQITVSGRAAGSVHAVVGATAVTDDFIGNGTFTDYVTADANNTFDIVMSQEFDGCITDILVYEMPSSINMGVVDLDGNLMQDLSAYGQTYDNIIILHVNTSDFTFPKGCYRLWYSDPCDDTPEVIESNCFKWQTTHPGTKLIKAIDNDGTIRFSYGFRWPSNNFYLIQRVEANFRKPTHDTKANVDRFSTGRHFRSYAEKSKKWELAIAGLDETQHACMDTMWGCMLVSIDGVYYFSDYEEYVPLWDEGGYNTLADVKFDVTRRDDVIFSDNCNR